MTIKTFGSVCSGIEAASYILKPLGVQPLWLSEIEDFPCRFLDANYQETPNLGDMNDIPQLIKEEKIEAPDLLSGGQQKKLQLLTMLIMGQPVLLLDEPLAGLDSASVNVLMTLLQETIQQTNQTVLMISHQRQGLTGFVDYELHFADQQLTLIGGTQHV